MRILKLLDDLNSELFCSLALGSLFGVAVTTALVSGFVLGCRSALGVMCGYVILLIASYSFSCVRLYLRERKGGSRNGDCAKKLGRGDQRT